MNALVNDVDTSVVGLRREAEILTVALAQGCHTVLEGPPGTHLPRSAGAKPATNSVPEAPVAQSTPKGAVIPPQQPFALDPLIK